MNEASDRNRAGPDSAFDTVESRLALAQTRDGLQPHVVVCNCLTIALDLLVLKTLRESDV